MRVLIFYQSNCPCRKNPEKLVKPHKHILWHIHNNNQRNQLHNERRVVLRHRGAGAPFMHVLNSELTEPPVISCSGTPQSFILNCDCWPCFLVQGPRCSLFSHRFKPQTPVETGRKVLAFSSDTTPTGTGKMFPYKQGCGRIQTAGSKKEPVSEWLIHWRLKQNNLVFCVFYHNNYNDCNF